MNYGNIEGFCRSTSAEPAENSCREKEHSQTLKRIDELWNKTQLIPNLVFFPILMQLIRIIYRSPYQTDAD